MYTLSILSTVSFSTPKNTYYETLLFRALYKIFSIRSLLFYTDKTFEGLFKSVLKYPYKDG